MSQGRVPKRWKIIEGFDIEIPEKEKLGNKEGIG